MTGSSHSVIYNKPNMTATACARDFLSSPFFSLLLFSFAFGGFVLVSSYTL